MPLWDGGWCSLGEMGRSRCIPELPWSWWCWGGVLKLVCGTELAAGDAGVV